MKKQSYSIAVFSLLLLFCFSFTLFAQSNKVAPPTITKYSTSSNTADVNAFTDVQPQNQMSAEERTLLLQLQQARTNNNVTLAQQLQAQLNRMHGVTPAPVNQSSQIEVHGGLVKQQGPEPDYNVHQINPWSIWSNATATVPAGYPNANRIYVVSTVYGVSAADTLKYYYSDNGGASWTYFYTVYFGNNHDYLSDDMNLVVVNDGTSIWLWTTAALYDFTSARNQTVWIRFNATTGAGLTGSYMAYPGNGAGNNYYNARITTDNSNYTTASYVYFICSFDSLYSGTSHFFRQKYAVCENPFVASPTILYPQANGGGFWWNSSGETASDHLWSDIAYYRDIGGSGLDRVYTVYNYTTLHNIYLAWSDNYGTSNTGSVSITEANVTYGARIAFNGGPTYRSGMVTYTRQFGGTDWDPYYQNTTTGGTTTGAWSGGFIDASTNRARSTDIIALRGANNLFRTAYAQDNPSAPTAYSNNWTGSAWGTIYPVSSIVLDTIYGKPRAGYTTGADNCLTIYSGGPLGVNVYDAILCSGTTGISGNNNGIPKTYALSQNYPNPFNPSTSIKFDIPRSGFVKLIVTDITGRQVASLVNQQLNAGSYDYSFDASNLASGVYFYKISVNDFVEVKKMVLIK